MAEQREDKILRMVADDPDHGFKRGQEVIAADMVPPPAEEPPPTPPSPSGDED